MNNTEIEILRLLQQHGEIKGTNELARLINTNNITHVVTSAALLEKNGLIARIPGRAPSTPTIYRRASNIMEVKR